MAWIQSHQSLRYHPKTRRLARRVGGLPAAIGHLQCLWWWCLDYAPDGDLERFDDEDIADAGEWTGDAAEFVAALTAAGFLDANRHVHDWDEYTGALVDQRVRNRERMANARKQAQAGAVQDTCETRAAHEPDTLKAREDKRREEKSRTTTGVGASDASGDATLCGTSNVAPSQSATALIAPETASDMTLTGDAETDDFGNESEFQRWLDEYGYRRDLRKARPLYWLWRRQGARREELLLAAKHDRADCELNGRQRKYPATFLARVNPPWKDAVALNPRCDLPAPVDRHNGTTAARLHQIAEQMRTSRPRLIEGGAG